MTPAEVDTTMNGSYAATDGVEVTVRVGYVESQSSPEEQRYFFAYEVTIENVGEISAKLVSRHWIIADGTGEEREVRGPGVVGEQPLLTPGELFSYTSYCPIDTPVGSMRGSFRMVREDGSSFDAKVAPFTLAVPHALN